MSILSKLFLINCSRAAECCNKLQYKEASGFDKFKLKFHLLFCKTCRKFSKQNSKLTKAIDHSNLQSCSEEQKMIWKEQIIKEHAEGNV